MPKGVQAFLVLAAGLSAAATLALLFAGARYGLAEPYGLRSSVGLAVVLFIVFGAAGLVIVYEGSPGTDVRSHDRRG